MTDGRAEGQAAIPGASGGSLRGKLAASSLPVCFAIATLEGFDLQAAGVAAPALGPDLGLSPRQLGLFFSAATFGLILGAVIGGRVSDLKGRRATLLLSVFLFGAFSILTALAWDDTSLIAFRFLTGLGLGGALPSLLAITAETQAPDRRAGAVAILYAGFPTGGAIAALVSMAGAGMEWRMVFLIGGLAPLLIVPFIALLAIPRAPSTVAGRGREFARLVDRSAIRVSLLLWSAFALALLVLYLLLNWLPTLLISRGLSPGVAAAAQFAFNAVGALAGLATGAALRRWRTERIVLTAFALLILSLAALAAMPATAAAAVMLSAFAGAAMVSVQALLYAQATAAYPPEIRGTGVGAAVAAGRIGSVVGPLLAGMLIAGGRSAPEVLAFLVPLTLVSGICAVLLSRILAARGEPGR